MFRNLILSSFLGSSILFAAPVLPQNLACDISVLRVEGSLSSSYSLYLNDIKWNVENKPKSILCPLNSTNDYWSLNIELIDPGRVASASSVIKLEGIWYFQSEPRNFNLSYRYNDYSLNSNYLDFYLPFEYSTRGSETYPLRELNKITITNLSPISHNYEVIDIPGLIFNIFALPFTFIIKAFDLTIFPGTPYQLNLSNLFMIVLSGLTFLFLIKYLMRVIK